jgi:hypothetical protein
MDVIVLQTHRCPRRNIRLAFYEQLDVYHGSKGNRLASFTQDRHCLLKNDTRTLRVTDAATLLISSIPTTSTGIPPSHHYSSSCSILPLLFCLRSRFARTTTTTPCRITGLKKRASGLKQRAVALYPQCPKAHSILQQPRPLNTSETASGRAVALCPKYHKRLITASTKV